ncbi:polyisoprenoid-binding protein YceI [Paucibacter oligotrophus]|uniref:Polyisoprenoid-binding protein YceI n=1 Tax=Roseateles oligotrophus TaxID=1769250 RepID=A0A840LCN0_9BURK|nr:YceI family protein [Roseateles oligotrophus]MBB4843077.1 polyisoprenoid-binding protein YceI [Roseateles oligotrophus]
MKKLLIVAAALAAASLAQAQTATYAIEPTHTFVTYEISHFGTSTNRGRFDKKEGTVQLDKAAKTGRVEVTFDIASVNTGVAPMNKHLLGDDFFAADKFPTAKFVGDKFVFNGDKVSEVQGQLTLKDKTAPATLKATNFNCYQSPMLKREVCGGDFEAVIDRTQWGIDYGLAWGFPKNVKLVIQVEAVKQ